MTKRPILASFRGMPASDGAGVRLTRMLGTPQLPDLDPFLMLDQFRSDDPNDYIAGFPDHPHRGFETVTVMLAGRMRHADSRGNEGVIEPGGVQWMTAGRGIVHSERPEQADGLMWGFQLWLNLPAAHKMADPGYQEFDATRIPDEKRDSAMLRVIAGETDRGTVGVARSVVEPILLDVSLEPGATFAENIGDDRNAFAAIYAGALSANDLDGEPVTVSDPDLAVFGRGDEIAVTAGPNGARFLLGAARPLREPVARHGPFVMNTDSELREAFRDFQSGRFA